MPDMSRHETSGDHACIHIRDVASQLSCYLKVSIIQPLDALVFHIFVIILFYMSPLRTPYRPQLALHILLEPTKATCACLSASPFSSSPEGSCLAMSS